MTARSGLKTAATAARFRSCAPLLANGRMKNAISVRSARAPTRPKCASGRFFYRPPSGPLPSVHRRFHQIEPRVGLNAKVMTILSMASALAGALWNARCQISYELEYRRRTRASVHRPRLQR